MQKLGARFAATGRYRNSPRLGPARAEVGGGRWGVRCEHPDILGRMRSWTEEMCVTQVVSFTTWERQVLLQSGRISAPGNQRENKFL
ncbi:predicted protein [Chaetomium globosum CBS 148.51]|uniref:Uncharacterized protein n=1 Tax=Chaetomium globosum (strain ATCC 6205 / CBS 148.51 / DSM 1962 / NBRC 6347 / NRRL 1970) TaxID=306901 RepID=Q2H6B9_CHAGB|nr:uncharacterized protein CHGG_05796 [Chaetomium globosum CBS 148.51]EAQ89177.1 predicted protein [Chaetomium globosum CBS 148.51]